MGKSYTVYKPYFKNASSSPEQKKKSILVIMYIDTSMDEEEKNCIRLTCFQSLYSGYIISVANKVLFFSFMVFDRYKLGMVLKRFSNESDGFRFFNTTHSEPLKCVASILLGPLFAIQI